MSQDFELKKLQQGSDKHQQKLRMFKKNIQKFMSRDPKRQVLKSSSNNNNNLDFTSPSNMNNRLLQTAQNIQSKNAFEKTTQNDNYYKNFNLNTQKQFYKDLNIQNQSFNYKLSDGTSPKNNDFSNFNSTLFKNQSIFNENKSNHIINNQINTNYIQSSSNWMEEVSSYSMNSGGFQENKYIIQKKDNNSKDKKILNDIDQLLNNINKKNYGKLHQTKNQDILHSRKISGGSSGNSTARKLQQKYNFQDLNIDASRFSGLSNLNSQGIHDNSQAFVQNYRQKSDFIKEISPRINQNNNYQGSYQNNFNYKNQQKNINFAKDLPPRAQQVINNSTNSSIRNKSPLQKNKLKTIEEQQGANTLTIQHNVKQPEKLSSIQKQKAKIRQAMSGKKKTSQQIVISGSKYRGKDSKVDFSGSLQDHNFMKESIELRDKSFNFSIDFELSDQQDSYIQDRNRNKGMQTNEKIQQKFQERQNQIEQAFLRKNINNINNSQVLAQQNLKKLREEKINLEIQLIDIRKQIKRLQKQQSQQQK